MSARESLKNEILNKAVVHGKVILSSGKEADYYVDLRRVTLDSVAAPLVGEVMLELTKDLDYEAVGGLTLGADPVATAMMHVAGQKGRKLDSFVVRKAEKAHGLQRRIEGPDVKGKKVLAVEDTSTTGGSVLTAVEALKEAGAIVVAVGLLIADCWARLCRQQCFVYFLQCCRQSRTGCCLDGGLSRWFEHWLSPRHRWQ